MDPFEIRRSVAQQSRVCPYERRPLDPPTRPLRIYALDPSLRRTDGAITTLHVPYEPLEPGPVGRLFEVECADGDLLLAPLDLEDPRILIQSGLPPSTGNPNFHHQMIYAVASNTYASFRTALGRVVAWRAQEEDQDHSAGIKRLRLRPHVQREHRNAVYDPDRNEIRFGYVDDPRLPETGRIFSCLSADVISHEITHALIDGLRSYFTIPTNPDVLALHEGLADLVALFHRFQCRDVVTAQIRKLGPGIQLSALLTQLAIQFARDAPGGPRDAANPDLKYDPKLPSHRLGNVLVAAVFDAFVEIYRRKIEPYIRIAGQEDVRFMREELVQILAAKAASLARQFLNICIRGIDYCPPVDVDFGEYLRAVLTADFNLVRDDPWRYRETLLRAFENRGIYARGVMAMSEDELLWKSPNRRLPPIQRLSFSELKFDGDPAVPASPAELMRQARALGEFLVASPELDEFGLTTPGGDVSPMEIHTIRASRRVGPDGQVLFDLVAEVTQKRLLRDENGMVQAKFVGGSTIVIGPRGEIRYIISKNIGLKKRMQSQLEFQKTSPMWVNDDKGQFRLAGMALQIAHAIRAAETPGSPVTRADDSPPNPKAAG